MKELYQKLFRRINGAELVSNAAELCHIEMGQTFKHYHQAIDHICSLMRAVGIPNVEKLEFPADGVTVYEDKRMPLAWNASTGRLTLCDADKTVAADYEKHPFHLVKGSCSTAPGGETMPIITEEEFHAGADAANALVMLDTSTWPRADILTPVLDRGGRGIITDFMLGGRQEYPDALQWVNACTEGRNWHVQCDDREFIAFSVSLTMGEHIRSLAKQGGLTAFVECDGCRSVGTLPAATALVPGRRKEEIWLLAHTFEPLMDDDACGVVSGIKIAEEIMRSGTPEYSFRLIFAMELYGFAAFHANFTGKVIGAANIDSIPCGHGDICKILPPIRSVPFHGIDIMHKLYESLQDEVKFIVREPCCVDDMFLSDANIGIPTVWFLKTPDTELFKGKKSWHSSLQTEDGFLDEEVFAKYTASVAAWFHEVLFFTGRSAELPPLSLTPVDSPLRREASKLVYARVGTGLPQDQVKVPPKLRCRLPDGVLYGPFGSLLSGMDGKKDLAQIILETEADRKVQISDADIEKYLDAIKFLAEWGYLKQLG